jgi:hypothetical protein
MAEDRTIVVVPDLASRTIMFKAQSPLNVAEAMELGLLLTRAAYEAAMPNASLPQAENPSPR